MAGIADKLHKVDKVDESKSVAELADAPVEALQGVSEGDARKLKQAFSSACALRARRGRRSSPMRCRRR
jgi:hypothetical protein